MSEQRFDTVPMSRADIEAALNAHARVDTLPMGIAQAVADAAGLDVTECPLCREGLVDAGLAARVLLVIEPELEEEPITRVEP